VFGIVLGFAVKIGSANTLRCSARKAQIPLVASRHDATHTTCLFQHGGRRRSSSARVYKFSILCSVFASISGTTSGKSEVDMSTAVHAVAMPLNTCHVSRACRACRDEHVMSCCDVTQKVKCGLTSLRLTINGVTILYLFVYENYRYRC